MRKEHADHVLNIISQCHSYMTEKTDFESFEKEVSEALQQMKENKPAKANDGFLNWCKKVAGGNNGMFG